MSKHVDLSGTQYGNLIVIGRGDDYISPSGSRLMRWKCRCKCGKEINATTSQLKRGLKSCGCISRREDLTGKRFGKLIVECASDDYISPQGAHMAKWRCICDCGNKIDVLGMSLKNGDCTSCGCFIKEYQSIRKRNVMDLSGNKYGDLEVISKIENKKPTKYLCNCSCGKSVEIYQKDLTSGRKTHCGCKTVKVKKYKEIEGGKKRTAERVIGNIYGELFVIDELEPHITPNGSKQRIVKCRCSCGNEVIIRLTSAKSSGMCRNCKSKENRVDISGKRFGKLIVLSMAEDYISPSGHRLSQCKCKCDCGKTTVVLMSQLVTGGTKSCGCISNTRGLLKDYPEYMLKYDYEKNQDVDLEKLTVASSQKVWWKCTQCKNSWLAVVSSQTDLNKKHGCPYCSGRFVIKGKTDLESQKPEMLYEWDYLKNSINPNEISCFSGQKVWWICSECGHSWQQTVANRVSGSGCPKCNIENVNSFCEQAVYYYIKQSFPDAINGDNHIGMELDIYIPSISVAIEYDGEAWHNTDKKIQIDERKNKLCIQNNIELIRIREPKCKEISDCKVFVREDSTSNVSLNVVIQNVLKYISSKSVDVDTSRDTAIILEQFATKKYLNSLEFCYPEIAKEWHPTKNGKLTPDKVNKASRFKVWWLGKCGHEWDMRVNERTVEFVRKNGKLKKQYGCPYCSGKRILIGFNDLKSQNPEVAKEWDYEKNGDITPESIMVNSNKMVWWRCSKGHEWEATPNRRYNNSGKCPICYRLERSPSVVCVETGEIFKNSKSAAARYNIKNPERIYKCCRNCSNTVGGYHWQYFNDKNDKE